MKVGREDAATEQGAVVEAEEKPPNIVAAVVGADEGAVAVTGSGAPSTVTAPATVTVVELAVGEKVKEDMAVDL